MPEEKKKKASSDHSSPLGVASTNGGRDIKEWVEMNAIGDKDTASRKGKGKLKNKANGSNDFSSVEDLYVNKSFMGNSTDNSYGNNPDSFSNGDLDSHNMSRDSMYDYDLDDSGPHREMAVDVPENFIASIKSPPRYPPPQSAGGATHSSTSPSKSSKDRRGNKLSSQDSLDTVDSGTKRQQNYQQQQEPTPQELKRLHRHQEALQKRREEEKKLQAEEEFLRASLRESKKLKALENGTSRPNLVGQMNTGYDDDDFTDRGDGKPHSRTASDITMVEPYLKKNVGVDDLFSCLHHIRNSLTTTEDQKYISFLRLLFQNEHFQNAVSLHNQLVELTARSPPVKPVTDEAEELHAELQHYSTRSTHNSQALELFSLLNKPIFKSLLRAHDTISQQAVQPNYDTDYQEPIDYPLVQYGKDTVKIIHLEKTTEHLGATVKNEGESVVIGRIVKGGVAEKSGLLHEGDEILEVNGIDMRGKNINDVSEMLANMTGTITFMIIPSHNTSANVSQKPNKVMHLRALFSYEPEDDPYIPCRELGISFIKGDILHAIALDDPNWWQAFREGEEEHQSLAGLIPSKSFAEQREALKSSIENKENKRKHRVCACGKKKHKNKKDKKSLGNSDECDEFLSYEEIVRYYPQPNRKRPIVLIGPSNVGRNELQQRLLDSDPDRFGAPVPHTTCPPRSTDLRDGAYNHISREEFNVMIQQNQFVEFGYHQKYMYGTSFDAVREVITQGKICLLKIQPETVKVIRASDLMPYIVFVRPPTLDKLFRLQDQLKTPVQNGVRKGKEVLSVDDQLRSIIDVSREIEEQYGYLFDFVLVNSDLDQAYTELLMEINRIEIEPQWVPAAWLHIQ